MLQVSSPDVLRCVRDCNTIEGDALIFDRIEWDDANLEHATVRVSSAEIEQAIWNARRMFRHRSKRDRVFFRSRTDGGRPLMVVAQLVRDGARLITAWEEER
jgi:hypothetical protein